MKISFAVLEEIEKAIKDMFVAYQGEMDQAYLAAGDEPLKVAIGVKIAPDGAKLKIVTSINFVKDRCKDEVTSWVDEEQINLFDEGGQADGI